jgi:hypothetical protein
MMKAIETTGIVTTQGQLSLDEPLAIALLSGDAKEKLCWVSYRQLSLQR